MISLLTLEETQARAHVSIAAKASILRPALRVATFGRTPERTFAR